MRFCTILCVALVVFLSKTSSAAPLSDWVQGEVLNFGGPSDGVNTNTPSGALVQGACGYGPFDLKSFPSYNIAAISPQNPLAANLTRHPKIGCGACLELTCIGSTCPANNVVGENNPLIVMVADSCPSCTPNQLVIPYVIFHDTLSNSPSVGTATVQYRHVDCTPRGPIVIDVDTYRPTEGGYIRLSLESVAGSGALRSVELRGASSGEGSWLPMVNAYGAKWELSNLPNIPMDMRITSDDGTVLVQPEAINESRTGGFATFVQFAITGGTITTTPTPPPTEEVVPSPPLSPPPSPSPVPSSPPPPPPAAVVESPWPARSRPPPPSPSPAPSVVGIENPFLVTPTPPRSPSVSATAAPPPTPTPLPSPPATRMTPPPSPPAPVPAPAQRNGSLCINTVVTTVLSIPELSTTSQNIATAGLTSLLNNASSVVTFFAPTNQAWAALPSSVNINDRAGLQDIMLGLVVEGSVTLPSGAVSEASTISTGGQITVPVKTLNGAPLSAIASASGVVVQDANAASPDARIIRAIRVCDSVVDVVDAVPLPF